MPIQLPFEVRRLTQREFGKTAFSVMRDVFAIHAEFGRFFNERIYKTELARRRNDAVLEAPVDVSFLSFRKRYFVDVLVGGGALFEFKAHDALVPRDRAQTTHYLHLCDLAHAKLVNMRTPQIQHEFVNTALSLADRMRFEVVTKDWDRGIDGASRVEDAIVPFVRDVGTGLEMALYEEAIVHFLGGEEAVVRDVDVQSNGTPLGTQRVRIAAPGVAVKVTAFPEPPEPFENHAKRLIKHSSLTALLWINIARDAVTLRTIR